MSQGKNQGNNRTQGKRQPADPGPPGDDGGDGGDGGLFAAPLTAAAFAPFGDVIAAPPSDGRLVNDGRADRCDMPAALAHANAALRPTLAVYRVRPSALPFAADLFECHPASSQLFVPMAVGRYLVVVAPSAADGRPDASRALAFVAAPATGVHYRAGIWHVPLTVLDSVGVFSMLIWEDGTAGDTIEYRLARPIRIRA